VLLQRFLFAILRNEGSEAATEGISLSLGAYLFLAQYKKIRELFCSNTYKRLKNKRIDVLDFS
jgi:hypothetical protein